LLVGKRFTKKEVHEGAAVGTQAGRQPGVGQVDIGVHAFPVPGPHLLPHLVHRLGEPLHVGRAVQEFGQRVGQQSEFLVDGHEVSLPSMPAKTNQDSSVEP
jgi:hypothetical protein